MPTTNPEIARLMSIKAALVVTTNTQGWEFIKQIADNIVTKTINEALDEEERDKGESKRLKAAALRKGFAELWGAIDATKQFEEPTAEPDGLSELENGQ